MKKNILAWPATALALLCFSWSAVASAPESSSFTLQGQPVSSPSAAFGVVGPQGLDPVALKSALIMPGQDATQRLSLFRDILVVLIHRYLVQMQALLASMPATAVPPPITAATPAAATAVVAGTAPATPQWLPLPVTTGPAQAFQGVQSPAPAPAAATFRDTVPQATAPVPPRSDLDVLEQRILHLSNAYRQRNNLGPLRESSALNKLALGHSQFQADQGVMSHDNFSARMAASGRRRCVENVAVGYRSADEIVAAWINSPGHEKNLRNPEVIDIGIARERGYTTWFACR